jgi:oligopeptide transport system substrate-binding protein
MKKSFVFICLSLGMFLSLNAADILKRGSHAEVETLDLSKASSIQADRLLRDIFEGLIIVKEDQTLAPAVAEKWSTNEDKTVYTFTLCPNAKWSDGSPVTAHDFEAAWKRNISPLSAGTLSHLLTPLKNAAKILKGEMKPETLGVKALNDHTLEVTLEEPTSYFLSILDNMVYFPMHRASYDKFKDDFVKQMPFISNGAFVLKSRQPQEVTILEKNPYYHDAKNVRLTQVEYHPLQDLNLELKKYEVSELDMTRGVPNDKMDFIQKKFKDELKILPYALPYTYGFNITKAPFNNKKLRKALSLVVDRDIVLKITKGGELHLYSWVVPGSNTYTPEAIDYKKLSKKKRLALAHKLYQEAGYSAKKPLKMTFHYNVDDNHKKIAIGLAALWKKELGVQTDLIAQEFGIAFNTIKQKQETQVFRNFAGIFYNDPHAYLHFFSKNTGYDSTGFKNAAFDEALEKAVRESDPKKQAQFYAQAERILLDEHVIIPIYQMVSKFLVKPYVKGVTPNIFDRHLSKNIYFEK